MKEFLNKNFKQILFALGGAFAFFIILYIMMDYSGPVDDQILQNKWDESGSDAMGRMIVGGLLEDRQAMLLSQIIRTFGFALLVAAAIFAWVKNWIKPLYIIALLGIINLIDLSLINKKYLNNDDFVDKETLDASAFTKTAIDDEILKDTSAHFRVYNAGSDRFSASDYRVSSRHRAVGGYHPAKLRIYQDMLDMYFNSGANEQILNMLNTKYVIAPQQDGSEVLVPNPSAYGPAWLVKAVKVAANDAEALQTIGKVNLKDTIILEKNIADKIPPHQFDSSASIRLSKFDNDRMEYSSNAASAQLAVFSEIYYPMGWNAYIDGKQVDYYRANYLLRALPIPAGSHKIVFAFEPKTYFSSVKLAFVGSILVLVLIVGGFFMYWWKNRKAVEEAAL